MIHTRSFSFSLKEVEDEELLSGLEKDFFNLIFVRKHMIDPELYTFHALTADRLVAVFPEAHPSASKKSVSLSELKKRIFYPDASAHFHLPFLYAKFS